MDMSSGEWLADLGMEDAANIIHHCQMMMGSNNANMEGFDNLLSRQPTDLFFDESNDFELISSLETKPQINNVTKEIKSEKDTSWKTYTSSNSSSERIISFGSLESDANLSVLKGDDDLINYEKITSINNNNNNNNNNAPIKNNTKWGNNKGASTSPYAQEHVLAERKRREKMTERFLALSALIPGLKKMDKASILGDAAKHVKQLEEQIKKLEEQMSKRSVESVVLVKKSQQHLDNNVDYSSSSSNNNINPELMEIEARISNKNALIRVHLQKFEGLLQFILNEIHTNLHMSTLNCVTMPFGRFAIDITIIAEINGDGNSITSNDVVKHLGLALQQFTSL